jgi:arabinofuranosyltransferase
MHAVELLKTAATGRRRYVRLGAQVALVFVYLFLVWRFRFICDDAFITFRYSKNLALGNGPRFNLGGADPVEGYSNFLWMLIASGFEYLGLATPDWMRVLSALCGVWLLLAVIRFVSRRMELAAIPTLLCGLFLATQPTFTMWSTGGLATIPTALFLFLGFECLLGDPERPLGLRGGLCLLTASLLRADAVIWSGLILVSSLLVWMRRREPRLLRAGWVAAGVFIAGVGAYVLWRYSFYGDYLPHTARIRTGLTLANLERGVNYVLSNLGSMPATVVALSIGVISLIRHRAAVATVALAMVLATLGYAVFVGGDFMAMGRLTMPMVPFLVLLLAFGWRVYGSQRNGRAVISVLTLFCIVTSLMANFDSFLTTESFRRRVHFRLSNMQNSHWTEVDMWKQMKGNAEEWTRIGKALKELTEPGESMVVGPVGAIGYYSDLFIYDQYGLISREVIEIEPPLVLGSPGHDRMVTYPFFLRHRPTYLMWPMIVDADVAPNTALVKHLRAYHRDWVEIEVREMPAVMERPPGEVFWMIRLKTAL